MKGGKWFSLIDKVYPERTPAGGVRARSPPTRGRAGVDHVTVEMFETDAGRRICGNLSEELRTGTYRPQAIRRHYIPKPGSQEKRPLGIPTVRDRVVQTALRHVLEPIFERDFADAQLRLSPRTGLQRRAAAGG